MGNPPEVRVKCRWIKGDGSELSSTAFKCYFVLLAYANADSESWPSRGTLCRHLKLAVPAGKRQVTRLLAELQNWHLIEPVGQTIGGVTKWRVIVG